MKNLACLVIFCFSMASSWSQATVEESLRAGNDFYNKQDYERAAVEYNKVLQQDASNQIAKFNLANTLVKQKKLSEANKLFNDVAESSSDNNTSGSAYYNEGVVLTGQKRLEESIEAYKNALRKNPQDEEARDNLQKALQELKKKEPPKQQQQKQDQKKQEQKKQQQQKMSQREVEQRLDLLEQKEKEVQERLQKEKSKSGGGQGKDW